MRWTWNLYESMYLGAQTIEDQELREILLAGFDYSKVLDEWVGPIDKALSGLTVEQAIERPG